METEKQAPLSAKKRMEMKRERDRLKGKTHTLQVSKDFAELYRRFEREEDFIEHLKQQALREELDAKVAQQNNAAALMQELIDLLELESARKSK